MRIPEAVDSEQASLAYLTGLGLAAPRQARYETGENIVVVGLGVIGLSTIALARAMGAKVLGLANSEIRARAAVTVGATACVMADDANPGCHHAHYFHGMDADIVVLTSNSWDSYFVSLDLARKGGRVSILGFPDVGSRCRSGIRSTRCPSIPNSSRCSALGCTTSRVRAGRCAI